jgi:hypothetical protein
LTKEEDAYREFVEDLRVKARYSRILLKKLLKETDKEKQTQLQIQLTELLDEIDADIIEAKIQKSVEEL